jgi:hypothetical protein
MAMGGVGAGGQFGMELTDFVFVLTTDSAVKTFMQAGSLTLGGNISAAFGPIGRSAEAGGVLGVKGSAGVFAYSKTRGLYGGVTVEGGVIAERADANKKLYGRKVRAAELLTGLVPSPPEAGVLMDVLNGDFFLVDGTGAPSSEGPGQLDAQTTGVSAGGSSEQPENGSAPATGQAPQLPELSNFENLDMAQEPNVQRPLPVVDQGSAAEQDGQRETQPTQSSNNAHDHTRRETGRPSSSVQQEPSERANREEAKGKEPMPIKPDEPTDGPNIEHAH